MLEIFEYIYADMIINLLAIIELLLYFSFLIAFSVMLIHLLAKRKHVISIIHKFTFGFGIALIVISFSEAIVVWFGFDSMFIRRLETVFITLFVIVLAIKYRPKTLKISMYARTSIVLFLFLYFTVTLVSIVLFFSANFNVGVFWDDIFRYPWIANMYHNLGPTIRSPYVILPALTKFIADSVSMPFQHGYALLCIFTGFIILSIFSYFKSVRRNCRESIIWLTVIIVLFGSNLATITLLTNFLSRVDPSRVFEPKMLYDYTVDKYGPPQIVGSWIYLKAASFGGAFIFSSLAALNFAKYNGFSKQIAIILAIFLFSYGLLGGNLLLALMTFPLFLYKIFMLGRWRSILAFLLVLFCTDAIFKFSFLNQIVIKFSQLLKSFTYFPICFFIFSLMSLILISRRYQIFQKINSSFRNLMPKFNNIFAKRWFDLVLKKALIIVSVLMVIVSVFFEIINFDTIKYSDMWKSNIIFPFFYVTVRTFGWSLPIIIAGAFNLRDYAERKEFFLWLIGIVTSLIYIAFYSVIDYSAIIFINRVVSYIVFPCGFLISRGLERILNSRCYMLLMTFMILLSSFYVFWFTLGYYTTGVNFTISSNKQKLLVFMSTISKGGYMLVHNEEDTNLISSMPYAKVICAEKWFGSQKNDYAWYYWVLSEGNVSSIRNALKKLEIKYLIINLNTLSSSRILQNPNYLELLDEFKPIYQENNYIIFETNLLLSYGTPKCPTIPSPLNDFLGVKDCEK